jgi:hypothetical protein
MTDKPMFSDGDTEKKKPTMADVRRELDKLGFLISTELDAICLVLQKIFYSR